MYHCAVAPFTGAWIEIPRGPCWPCRLGVAPFTGAWIEIPCSRSRLIQLPSLPSRERGLKYGHGLVVADPVRVAPFTGAWIEIGGRGLRRCDGLVAPFTGAWIEMTQLRRDRQAFHVAPFTGAWIEISWGPTRTLSSTSRSLHGSVD